MLYKLLKMLYYAVHFKTDSSELWKVSSLEMVIFLIILKASYKKNQGINRCGLS